MENNAALMPDEKILGLAKKTCRSKNEKSNTPSF